MVANDSKLTQEEIQILCEMSSNIGKNKAEEKWGAQMIRKLIDAGYLKEAGLIFKEISLTEKGHQISLKSQLALGGFDKIKISSDWELLSPKQKGAVAIFDMPTFNSMNDDAKNALLSYLEKDKQIMFFGSFASYAFGAIQRLPRSVDILVMKRIGYSSSVVSYDYAEGLSKALNDAGEDVKSVKNKVYLKTKNGWEMIVNVRDLDMPLVEATVYLGSDKDAIGFGLKRKPPLLGRDGFMYMDPREQAVRLLSAISLNNNPKFTFDVVSLTYYIENDSGAKQQMAQLNEDATLYFQKKKHITTEPKMLPKSSD